MKFVYNNLNKTLTKSDFCAILLFVNIKNKHKNYMKAFQRVISALNEQFAFEYLFILMGISLGMAAFLISASG